MFGSLSDIILLLFLLFMQSLGVFFFEHKALNKTNKLELLCDSEH